MNGGKSDASTSTDDVTERPLCLFYFTHPFGVLSPEPPSVGPAPAGVARAFLNMEPGSPFYWPGSGGAPSPGPASYDLGGAAVHPQPLSVLSVAQPARARPRRDSASLSSSLPSDARFLLSARPGPPRRAPYCRLLPPLLLPSPRDLTDYGSEDIWPRTFLPKFSLPPIELPTPPADEAPSGAESACSAREARGARQLGVRKARRRRGRAADARRLLGRLLRRAERGE